ncbi:CHAP domain-containing protein, partial [Streptomyces sp. NPDC014892]|uniref:CHAP domain-containing protein n=1 Tax=Streptomyces sp. NPDC014892 TaxID=3364930 RepID=UPI0036F99D09
MPASTAVAVPVPLFVRTVRLLLSLAVVLAVATGTLVAGAGLGHAATRTQIAAIAEAEVGASEANGQCKKYGPCTSVAWCAYFASWVWRTAGVADVPDTAVARGVGLWGKERGQFSPRPAGGIGNPEPGDIVVYGTPAAVAGGHVSIVSAVHDNGTITTVDGNYGDKVARRTVNPRTAVSGTDDLPISGYVKPAGLESGTPATPTTGRVFHNVRSDDGSWSGASVADPNGGVGDTAEAGGPNGDLHVLTLLNGRVYHNLRAADGSWSGARQADGNGSIAKVAAATTPNGDLHVATLLSGRVFHNVRHADGSWTGAVQVDGNGAIGDVAVAGGPRGELHLVT